MILRGLAVNCHPSDVEELGRYRILTELGHGGMADVHLASVEGMPGVAKLQVIKTIRPDLANDEAFLSMFMDEARIATRLAHPNVVQTHDVGIADGKHFLAMEYIDGQSLHRLRSVEHDSMLEYVILHDVLSGLHYAHELKDYDGSPLGIVHRDVTPQNILVTYDGHTKVVDFGIAKAARRLSNTNDGLVKGKVRYMAPEQALSLSVDRKVDLFAVGVMLWEAAAKKPFWDDSLDDMTVGLKLVQGDYDPSPPNAPSEIVAICKRALARDASERYATARELQKDLAKFLGRSLEDLREELGRALTEKFAASRLELTTMLRERDPSGELAATAITKVEAPKPAKKQVPWTAIAIVAVGLLLIVVLRWPASNAPLTPATTTSPTPSLESRPPPPSPPTNEEPATPSAVLTTQATASAPPKPRPKTPTTAAADAAPSHSPAPSASVRDRKHIERDPDPWAH